MGLVLRDSNGMGRPVHLWPVSSRRALKAGRAREWCRRAVWGLRAGLCSSSCPPSVPLFLLLCPSFPAQEDHSWWSLCSIWCLIPPLLLLSPSLFGLEPFAQQAAMLFRGLCHQLRVQILETARHLIPKEVARAGIPLGVLGLPFWMGYG